MWAAEAKAAIDIPLTFGEDVSDWDNHIFKEWIKRYRGKCVQFTLALDWLGSRNYMQAIQECTNKEWLRWLNDHIPLFGEKTIKAGDRITITKGRQFKYALWDLHAIYDLPEEYVGEIIKIIAE